MIDEQNRFWARALAGFKKFVEGSVSQNGVHADSQGDEPMNKQPPAFT